MASSNREPLSDITKKFNITPTPALVQLFAASSSSNSLPKRPPSNSNFTNLKPFSESSSKSNTSIGSSNVSVDLNSKKTVQFRNPPPVISTVTSSGAIGSKDAAHNRRQVTEKSKKEREPDVIVIHTPVEKRNEKGKAVAVPLSSPPSENTKDNQNGNEGIVKHTRSSNLIIKETGQDFRNSSSFLVQRANDSGKPLNTVNSHEKTREKGKAIDVPLSSSPYEKTKDNQNGSEGILKHTRSSNLIIKEAGQEFLNPSSFLIPREKDSGKPLNTVNSHEKTREKGRAIRQPSGIIEIAEHNGSSTDVAVKSRPLRRKSEKRKFDAGDFSCPPMMWPKSIQNNLNEAGDVKSLKSCTDPNLKLRKKTASRIKKTGKLAQDSIDKLPEDFVEQQRAYFKEVDEFELAEEEASPDELD